MLDFAGFGSVLCALRTYLPLLLKPVLSHLERGSHDPGIINKLMENGLRTAFIPFNIS